MVGTSISSLVTWALAGLLGVVVALFGAALLVLATLRLITFFVRGRASHRRFRPDSSWRLHSPRWG
jgi:hypothetical protein